METVDSSTNEIPPPKQPQHTTDTPAVEPTSSVSSSNVPSQKVASKPATKTGKLSAKTTADKENNNQVCIFTKTPC